MLLLTGTSDLVQVVTSATSGSGYGVEVQAAWVDSASGTITPGRTNTAITTATTTTVVGSPAASTQRNARRLSIRNDHATDSCLAEVRHTDGTTAITLWKGTLLAGESAILDQDGNWYRLDSNGKRPGDEILRVEDWTSSGTSIAPAGATHAELEGCGAGGGGQGGPRTSGSGGVAGGGAIKDVVRVPVTGGTSYAVTIGAGGTAGPGASSNGATPAAAGDGGDTTYGSLATFIGAGGGEAGGTGQPSRLLPIATPAGMQTGGATSGSGAAGNPGNPSTAFAGGTGGTGSTNLTAGAGGGAGPYGVGANGGNADAAGSSAAANTGAGGGGGGGSAVNLGTNGKDGGVGGSGRLKVKYIKAATT